MKPAKKAKDNTPAVVETLTPDQAAEKAKRLRCVRMEAISELDMRHIMTTLVGRAKNGDHKATSLVFQLVEAGMPSENEGQRGAVHVNVGHNNQGDVSVVAIDRAGLQVVQLLASRGPLTPNAITTECGVPGNRLAELVDAEVIEYTPKGQLQLTPAGREATAKG
jgi:hypothetical protein